MPVNKKREKDFILQILSQRVRYLLVSKYWQIDATMRRGFDALSYSVMSKLKTASAVLCGSSSKKLEDEATMVNDELEQCDSEPNKRFIVGKCRSTLGIQTNL